jgi:drug/metabolite transporter (DMT)-like permease
VSRAKAELALGLNVVIWGTTFVLVKSALQYVSPVLFLAIRFSVAALAMPVLLRGRWQASRRITGKILAAGFLTGGFLFAGYLLQTLGLQFTTPPKSAFITGLCTVMVPLLAALVYKIRPQVSEVLGVVVATFGMGLMTLEGPVGSIGRGDLLTFGCAVAFAAHIVTLGHFSEQMGYEFLSITQIGAAALSALSLFWWVEIPHIQWHPIVLWTVLITGLLATALAFTIQAWAQQYTTATRTALIYALEPVIAWVTSYAIAGEGLSGRGAAGAVLILSGVLVVEMKPFRSRKHLLE